MMCSVGEQKHKVRQEIKNILKVYSSVQRDRQIESIGQQLETLPAYRKAKTVMFYWSISGEVGTKDLIGRAKEMNTQIALPVVMDKGEMVPYEFTASGDLVPGSLGILQPDAQRASPVSLDKLDVVIVPGVAFSRQGKRLGRGGGYYDRFLKKLPSSVKRIGLAFTFQVFEDLPFDPLQDEKVDLVITAQ